MNTDAQVRKAQLKFICDQDNTMSRVRKTAYSPSNLRHLLLRSLQYCPHLLSVGIKQKKEKKRKKVAFWRVNRTTGAEHSVITGDFPAAFLQLHPLILTCGYTLQTSGCTFREMAPFTVEAATTEG